MTEELQQKYKNKDWLYEQYLKPEEVIHHINGIKDDNRLSNLTIFKNGIKHLNYHNKMRRIKNVGSI